MNDTVKTTRKNFLKWSGLAFVGGLLFANSRSSSQETSELNSTVDTPQPLTAASRIRPAQNTVVRERV